MADTQDCTNCRRTLYGAHATLCCTSTDLHKERELPTMSCPLADLIHDDEARLLLVSDDGKHQCIFQPDSPAVLPPSVVTLKDGKPWVNVKPAEIKNPHDQCIPQFEGQPSAADVLYHFAESDLYGTPVWRRVINKTDQQPWFKISSTQSSVARPAKDMTSEIQRKGTARLITDHGLIWWPPACWDHETNHLWNPEEKALTPVPNHQAMIVKFPANKTKTAVNPKTVPMPVRAMGYSEWPFCFLCVGELTGRTGTRCFRQGGCSCIPHLNYVYLPSDESKPEAAEAKAEPDIHNCTPHPMPEAGPAESEDGSDSGSDSGSDDDTDDPDVDRDGRPAFENVTGNPAKRRRVSNE